MKWKIVNNKLRVNTLQNQQKSYILHSNFCEKFQIRNVFKADTQECFQTLLWRTPCQQLLPEQTIYHNPDQRPIEKVRPSQMIRWRIYQSIQNKKKKNWIDKRCMKNYVILRLSSIHFVVCKTIWIVEPLIISLREICYFLAKPPRRVTLFYICNEIVQTCKRKRATPYKESFQQILPEATALVRLVLQGFHHTHTCYTMFWKFVMHSKSRVTSNQRCWVCA